MPICPVCNEQEYQVRQNNIDAVSCQRCGEFQISGTAVALLQSMDEHQRAHVSGWCLDQDRGGAIAVLNSENIRQIAQRPSLGVLERADRLLVEAARNTKQLAVHIDGTEPRYLAATYSTNTNDIKMLMRLLQGKGFLSELKAFNAGISTEGLIRLDELRVQPKLGMKAFVAMWFSDELNAIYTQGFQSAIIEAGYDPVRMDKIEHVNRIDDEIIAQIRMSRFLVADFTGHRAGVYFEAGFALGLDIPVIWTCRKDDIKKLHFDIRQFNCIDWTSGSELHKRLRHRIEALIGVGPRAAFQ